MNTIDDTFRTYIPFAQDTTFTTIVCIILIIYAVFIAPYLSEQVSSWFDNTIIKIILFGIIAYLSRFNPTIALIATIAVIVSLMRYNEYKTARTSLNQNLAFTQVKYSNFDESNNIPPQFNYRKSSCGACGGGNYDKINTQINTEDNNMLTQDEEINTIITEYNKKAKKKSEMNEIPKIKLPSPESELTDENLQLLKCMGKDNVNIMDNVQEFNSIESNYAEFEN